MTDAPEEKAALRAIVSPPSVVEEGEAAPADAAASVSEAPAPARMPPDPARWMHQRLVHQILEFERRLGPGHEVGGRFVEGPNAEPLHISNLASWGPDMIIFMGEYADGRRFELIQHYSQVSVLLVAVPTTKDEPRRIGFELLKHVKDLPHPWGDPVS